MEHLKEAVALGDEDNTRTMAQTIVKTGLHVTKVVEELSATMRDVGAKFERCEVFLSENRHKNSSMVHPRHWQNRSRFRGGRHRRGSEPLPL